MARVRKTVAAIFGPYLISFAVLLVLVVIFVETAPEHRTSLDDRDEIRGSFDYGNAFFVLLTTFHGVTWGSILPITSGQVAAVCIAASLGFLWPFAVVLSLLRMSSQAALARHGAKVFAVIYCLVAVVGNLVFAGVAVRLGSASPGEDPGNKMCLNVRELKAVWDNTEPATEGCDFGIVFYYVWMTFHQRAYGDLHPQDTWEKALGVLIAMAATLVWVLPVLLVARKYMLLLEEKTHQALEEKVLRFQAEHEKDVIIGSQNHRSFCTGQSTYLDGCNLHDEAARGEMVKPQGGISARPTRLFAPASLHSAPANLPGVPEHCNEQSAASGEVAECSMQGDCLSPSTCVWVESDPVPRSVSQVRSGERILCYDRLTGSLKHAMLLDVRATSGTVEWAAVKLTDGTTLEMTADHFLQPVASPSGDSLAESEKLLMRPGPPVRAADLQPGTDSVMVLKVVPMPVQSVQTRTDDNGVRVSLTVQQPERHAIFAMGPWRQGDAVQTMAVESANVCIPNCMKLTKEQTFLNMSDACLSTMNGLTVQARSAPPSVDMLGVLNKSVQDQTEARAPAVQGFSDSTTWQLRSNGDDTESLKVYSEQVVVANSSDFVFLLGPEDIGKNHAEDFREHYRLQSEASETPPEEHVGEVHLPGHSTPESLSDPLHVESMGLRSVGSLLHAQGQCKPCAFQNSHLFRGGKPCVKGTSCEFCHEHHDVDLRKQKRHQLREYKHLAKAWENS